jgi:Cys-tRNA(Pro) deacylase
MLKKAGIDFTVHRYEYDASADRVGLQAAEALAQPQDRVQKTLMALVEGQLVCVIVPSDREVSMKKLAAVFGGKFAQMMNPADAERISVYKVGGISRAHYRSTRSRPRVKMDRTIAGVSTPKHMLRHACQHDTCVAAPTSRAHLIRSSASQPNNLSHKPMRPDHECCRRNVRALLGDRAGDPQARTSA